MTKRKETVMKKMISALLAMCMVLALLPVSAGAAVPTRSGTCGTNVTWTLSGTTLTLTGSGETKDYVAYTTDGRPVGFFPKPWMNSGDGDETTIETVVIGEGITSIGGALFTSHTSLTSVTIPSSVKSIGHLAFSLCTNLTELNLPNGLTSIGDRTFSGSGLTNITIPGSVSRLESASFFRCPKLAAVDIENGVKTVGDSAFYECTNLSRVTIPDSVTSIEEFAFAYTALKEVWLPKGLTELGASAFAGCTELPEIKNSSESFSTADGVLFNKNQSLLHTYPAGKTETSYVIPNSVVTVGDGAFYGCSKLTSVTIPAAATTIGKSAFCGCTALPSMTIPKSVTSIGGLVFRHCSNLASISVEDGSSSYSSVDGVLFNRDKSILLAYPAAKENTAYSVPSGVTEISACAFSYNQNLTEVTIPSSVTSMGNFVFEYSANLTNAVIAEGLERLTGRPFSSCKKLVSVTIPVSVNEIETDAFYESSALKDIYYAGTEDQWKAIKIGRLDFSELKDVTVHYNSVTDIPTSTPKIVSLTPTTGTSFPGTVFDIEFDREIAESTTNQNLPVANLGNGIAPFQIRRMSDDEVIFTVDNQNKVLTSLRYGASRATLRVDATNAKPKLETGVEYYVTMGAGYIQFTDGSTNPEIKKGEWVFRVGSSNVTVIYASSVGGDAQYSGFSYNSNWFLEDPYIYNHDLARLTLGMVMSGFASHTNRSYPDINIYNFYKSLGFETGTSREGDCGAYKSVGYNDSDHDSIAIAICKKDIYDVSRGETVTLVGVCLRGAGYGSSGWSGNFDVGNSGNTHDGFRKAAQSALAEVRSYISANKIDTGSVRIWLTGFSRAAATANLLAEMLQAEGLCSDKNLYAYTFATPNNRISSGKEYRNIYNIVNPADIVPNVPLTVWGFGKQGRTFYLPRLSELSDSARAQVTSTFASIVSRNAEYTDRYSAQAMYSWLCNMLSETVPTRDIYYRYFQAAITGALIEDWNALGNLWNNTPPADTIIADARALAATIDDWHLFGPSQQLFQDLTQLALDVDMVIDSIPKNSPVRPMALAVLDVLNGAIAEYKANGKKGYENIGIVQSALNMVEGGGSSENLKEHWGEVYLAWMMSINSSDLRETGAFKVAIVSCPVNVSVYDESGALVAHIVDDAVQEVSGSQVSAAVLGESNKVFVFPSGQDYRIVVDATDSGSMDYKVTENSIDGSVLRTVEFNDIPLDGEDQFTGSVDDTLYTDVNNYVLKKDDGSVIHPDHDSYTPPAPDPTPSKPSNPSSGGSSSSAGSNRGSSISVPSNITGGSVSVSPSSAKKGDTVTITAEPKSGYTLDTLTVKDSSGKPVALTDAGNGRFTFTMPNSKVSIEAAFVSSGEATDNTPSETSSFADVDAEAYYYDAVQWAVAQKITTGTGANMFTPDGSCTRAQMVTFLWRAAGSPAAGGTVPFANVEADSYYAEAVQWAVAQGITIGTGADTFSPDAVCTRGQAVTFLYRAAGSPAVSGPSPFADVPADAYYADAVQWAVAQGITTGVSSEAFDPNSNCTRAQIVTFLYRGRTD